MLGGGGGGGHCAPPPPPPLVFGAQEKPGWDRVKRREGTAGVYLELGLVMKIYSYEKRYEPSNEKTNLTPENSSSRFLHGNVLLWPNCKLLKTEPKNLLKRSSYGSLKSRNT